ncbi:endosome/lysosome-associated apoptosis and autophagy regulator family member 2-like isoform X2 [Eriocheir sinensis]|uniref:endosome/lysosome-associated apoptosis and autophagy regulator family member 2-like isoform X2 n=1 Tax=Eriocheir sinensis TaxID=95602 RepID=UPI0021CA1AAB|nr:endosome/lysosome-associated apoptosis and autophagy regulator family member 2-like isoform X2 [Eriocheir sinensis]
MGLSPTWKHLILWVITVGATFTYGLRTCQPEDFQYEFTECDTDGGRWRVSVPKVETCEGGDPLPPRRTDGCSVSCEPGWYFNVGELECRRCPNGTYSLGGGVKYDSWQTLPAGFNAYTEVFRSAFFFKERRHGDLNCSEYGWQTKGDVIASKGGPCAAFLMYTVKLVKEGDVTFVYQYTDEEILFEFEAQNSECQIITDMDGVQWPQLTPEGQWNKKTFKLDPGVYVLHWKTIGIDIHGHSRPVLIKSIHINGVAHSSECSPCPEGTYSGPAASKCHECPEDTHAPRHSASCQPCDPMTQYAPKGSGKCLPRPPCTSSDYYEMDSPCNEKNQTYVEYKWVEPMVCRQALEGSVPLPPSGKVKACPPCNPGMHYVPGQGCVFCPREHFGDGISSCQACAPNTAPNYGLQYQWWSSMPPNMASTCVSYNDNVCSSPDGWQEAGDHIQTKRGSVDDAYLVLSLKVQGFRGREGFVGGRPMEVGRISFTFELTCSSECQFIFTEASSKNDAKPLQVWTGSQPRQFYSYLITRNDSYSFSWLFQKVPWEKSSIKPSLSLRRFETDVAKIFNINVSNTVEGGASNCLPCFQAQTAAGCIPCPAGHYIEKNTTECTPCPPNTVVTAPLPYGPESCIPCGPGLVAPDHLSCGAECRLKVGNYTYDLRNISSPRSLTAGTLFTSSGTKFYHVFNISLCGNTTVNCSNNISYSLDGEPASNSVESRVCRFTLVPGVDGVVEGGQTGKLATQSVSLGDHIVGYTTNTTLRNISVIEEFANSSPAASPDLHFFYTTHLSTRACPSGRATTVTLRCDPDQPGQGKVSLPTQCPDGTCDGCNFHFLWSSVYGCRQCLPEDLITVHGECRHGLQKVHYISPRHCRPITGREGRLVPCSTRLPFLVEVIVLSTVCVALLLCLLLFCLWKKNQRLEYKYMKLVAKESSKDGIMELPPAESCALDDGEEEEVQFSKQPTRGILGKFKQHKVAPTEGRGLLMDSPLTLTSKDQLT